jgi:hypothetical protein
MYIQHVISDSFLFIVRPVKFIIFFFFLSLFMFFMFENYFYIHKSVSSPDFIIATNLLQDKPCMLLQLTSLFGIAKA